MSEGRGHPNDIALSIIRLNALGLLKGLYAKTNLYAISKTPYPKVIHIFFSALIKTAWFTPEVKQEIFYKLLSNAEVLSNPELLKHISSLSIILSKETFEKLIQLAADHKNNKALACQKLQAFIDMHTMPETPEEEISDDDIPLSTLLLEEYERLSMSNQCSFFINPKLPSESIPLTEEEKTKPLDEAYTLFRTSSFFCFPQTSWVNDDENPPQAQTKPVSD